MCPFLPFINDSISLTSSSKTEHGDGEDGGLNDTELLAFLFAALGSFGLSVNSETKINKNVKKKN